MHQKVIERAQSKVSPKSSPSCHLAPKGLTPRKHKTHIFPKEDFPACPQRPTSPEGHSVHLLPHFIKLRKIPSPYGKIVFFFANLYPPPAPSVHELPGLSRAQGPRIRSAGTREEPQKVACGCCSSRAQIVGAPWNVQIWNIVFFSTRFLKYRQQLSCARSAAVELSVGQKA